MGIIRRARLEEGPDYHDDGMVHRVADVCARCRREFLRSKHCATCNFNPASYLKGDIMRAQLMRVNAQLDHARRKQVEHNNNTADIGLIIMAIIILAFIFITAQTGFGQEKPTGLARVPYYEGLAADESWVELKVRGVVLAASMNVVDFDLTGGINALDYAIYFCLAYPGANVVLVGNKVYVRVIVRDKTGDQRWAVYDPESGDEAHLDAWSHTVHWYDLNDLYTVWKEVDDE